MNRDKDIHLDLAGVLASLAEARKRDTFGLLRSIRIPVLDPTGDTFDIVFDVTWVPA